MLTQSKSSLCGAENNQGFSLARSRTILNTVITNTAIMVVMLITTTVIQPQQEVYAATYKEPLGRFTIGYRDDWIPSFNSTRNSTNVIFKEKNDLTHIFSVMTLPKMPFGITFLTIGLQSTMMRFGYWITQPSFKLSLDGHETNSILISGVLQPQKEKFGSLILVSEIGNHTIMSTYLSKTPATFMQEVNDTAIPMVKSFHWLGLLQ